VSVLARYVLREHAGPFLLAVLLVVFVLLMDVLLQAMDQVLSKGVTPGLAAQLLFYNLAWIVALAVPMAVLVAVLMAFARLAADNEVLAAKACGVGFHQLLAPVLAAAGLLSVLMVLFNDLVLPDWNLRARNLATGLRRRKAAVVLKQIEGVVVQDIGSYSLLVRRVDRAANRLGDITVFDTRGTGPLFSLHARSGRLELLEDGARMRLWLEDGEWLRANADDPGRVAHATFARQVLHIDDPERAFRLRDSSYRSDREMNIGAMRAAVRQRAEEVRASDLSMDSLVAAYLQELEAAASLRDGERLLAEGDRVRAEIERHQRLNEARRRRISQFRVEIHKKFSIPVACLVFVLAGAPLGTAIRGRGVAVSIGISLAFFWVYWMFLIGGEELADRGFVDPAVSMWAPNLLFGGLGLYLAHRTATDRPWLAPLHRRAGR